MAEAVALSVGEKIGGCLIEPIQRELGYLFCFNTNIQELETRLDQLKATKNDVQAREDEARSSWKTLGEAANLWMVDANGKIIEADAVISDKAELQKGCFSIKWCPNIKLRFSLGRKGKKLSLVLGDLLQSGRPYLSHTVLALPMPAIDVRHDNDDDADFDSRRKPMEETIELLQDKETRLIGICGMGGIGKTTFANQILQKVQDLRLFAFQFMLTVSSNPEFSTIQQQALKNLGFNPSSTERVDEKEMAQRLRNALDKKKVLIVLDDVWEDFDLNAKGFLLKQSDVESCCKIIYTSRKKDLWSRERNITKQIISLDLLSEEEALNLFRKKVCLGDHDDEFSLKKEIEIEIVNECGRLPLAIEVVGSALFQKRIYEWNNMLTSFRNHNKDMHIEKINKVLETSYNFLEDDNLKNLFLLCCLFPEDREIPIETLCRYAEGLQLFESINGLKHVRNRVYTLVDNLIRRSLIINVEAMNPRHRLGYRIGERGVKVHDVVRDVGLSIGKRHEKGFGCLMCNDETDLKKDISEHTYTKIISIFFHNRDLIDLALDRLAFGGSNLELLCLDDRTYTSIKIPLNFFQTMDNLKVLEIASTFIPNSSCFSSFSYLVKLKMLSLENLRLKESDLSIIGHLRELEILSFRDSRINVLPNEISQLTNLRLLDLTSCRCFISNGVLSKLTNLQELYMWNSLIDWWVPKQQSSQSTMDKDNDAAAKLIELNELNKLWRLELEVLNIEQVQRGVKLLSSSKLLEYFKIRIESGNKYFESGDRPLLLENKYFESGDRQLLLENIKDNFSDELGVIMENKITNLFLYDSSVIWENMHLKGFLKDIVLKQCGAITTLFQPSQSSPPHTSNGLGLRTEEHKIFEFNSLETLILDGLCRLESFCKGINEIHFDKLKRLELKGLKQFIFPAKLKIPCLKELIIESIPNLKSLCNFCPPSLKELTIQKCEDFMYVFSTTSLIMMGNISHLSKLHIEGCNNIKGIILISTNLEEERNVSSSFSNLQILKLISLEEFVSFVIKENEVEKKQNALFYRDQVSFPCLEVLEINGLPKINYMVGWNDGLQHHELEECYHKDIDQQPFLPILKEITLHSLMEFVSFVGVVNDDTENNGEKQNTLSHHQLKLQGLENLVIHSIPNLKILCNFSAPFLKTLSIYECVGLVYLIYATSVMKENISHLSELYIRSCRELKGIIFVSTHPEEKGNESFSFPNLQGLYLTSLDKLVSFVIIENEEEKMQSALFYHNQVLFPCLQRSHIEYLPKINYIVGWNGLHQQGHRNDKDSESKLEPHILFPLLKDLWLEGLSNLLHICESNNSELGGLLFQNLKILRIVKCEKLKYLFSKRIARDAARHLKHLRIFGCPMMEVVMKKDDDDNIGGEGESISLLNYNHFLPVLEKLELYYLPELKRFCDVADTWALPLLKRLEVESCPKLEALSPGCLNTPKLETLKYNNTYEIELTEGDINNTMQQFFNREYVDSGSDYGEWWTDLDNIL